MFVLEIVRLLRVARRTLWLGLAVPACVLAQTRIQFDDVGDATDIRTHYQPQGVTWSCDGTACAEPAVAGGVFARATPATASPPNSVTPLRTGAPGVKDANTGRVVASFATPVKRVSIDALSTQLPEPLNQRHYAQMVAFDAAGAVVSTATGTQYGTLETLTVGTSDNRIVKVSLGVSGGAAVAIFDNLVFDRMPQLWSGVVLVLILVLILVVVARAIRKKKALR
jgi:hypothetical protein